MTEKREYVDDYGDTIRLELDHDGTFALIWDSRSTGRSKWLLSLSARERAELIRILGDQ
jgi:hypothetical protein